MIRKLRDRRLAKFAASIVVVVLVMVGVGYLAFLDAAAQIEPGSHGIVARDLAVVILAGVLGIGAIGVVLARPTVRGIEELAAHTAEIEAGNLDTGVETDAAGELARS